MPEIPSIDVDLFSDNVQIAPWSTYDQLREAAPVVHVQQATYDVYAVTRFEPAQNALRDWKTFTSADGIGFNDLMNERAKQTAVGSDPPEHTARRKLLHSRLKLSAVRSLQEKLQVRADGIVKEALASGGCDAVEMAESLVMGAVGDLIGIHPELARRFLREGQAFLSAIGPANERFDESWPVVLTWLKELSGITKHDVEPGSIGWDLFEAAEAGELPPELTSAVIFNILNGAAFFTTISGISTSINALARDPEQWELLRADPSRAADCFNEALRYDAPIHIWGRGCRNGADVDGYEIPAGARVAVLIGAANRDERKFVDAATFDLRRDSGESLSFGWGIHRCVGAPLATLEASTLLTALAQQVTTIKPMGSPQRSLNNTMRRLSSLPVRLS